ncbi:Flp pilus assembly pilin Flp [Sedimentibacter acidaminivorans]|uniref:Flp pilus assembly pilin Flp n=1 Tax=Sedimentibacter acidaminivorans TaxID=913099 RepID=A0ABS4GGD0_9FIRM|nr:hypothetical protein [Sedimentibacter acidaminivorans]MBP1926731.1 Flp pilus assembly pilin Flp [Sedimentibacter acidaminivorans]
MKGGEKNIKIRKYIKNEKGVTTIQVIALLALTAMIAIEFLPKFQAAIDTRNDAVVENFNSTDTKID